MESTVTPSCKPGCRPERSLGMAGGDAHSAVGSGRRKRPARARWPHESGGERSRSNSACCGRRCRFGPHTDRRLRHGKEAVRAVNLEFRRVPTGSRQTRRVAQIGIGVNNPALSAPVGTARSDAEDARSRERHAGAQGADAQGRHGGRCLVDRTAEFDEEQHGTRDPEMHQTKKGNQWHSE